MRGETAGVLIMTAWRRHFEVLKSPHGSLHALFFLYHPILITSCLCWYLENVYDVIFYNHIGKGK